VAIVGSSITITEGRLFGEPPGGVIRYRSGSETDETDTSSIGFVALALSNFEYETLTSEIDYNADGDLNLQLQLTGRNPDLETNRPVVLNLGVENNVPQMLKSLRAARSVEDILTKHLQ
jgi:electron transfer flavoprotein alpha/beta subunit